jgi:TRAP-type C4-dicarboxylate transport system substrate-binding protein
MEIRRRRLITAALALGGASAFIGGRASAQAKVLRFGHLHSVDSPVHKGIARAAEEIETADRPPSSGPGGMLVQSWPLR